MTTTDDFVTTLAVPVLNPPAFIMAWDPESRLWIAPSVQQVETWAKQTESGKHVNFGWGIGSRKRGVGPRNPAYIYRVGEKRGIYGWGKVTSPPQVLPRMPGDRSIKMGVQIRWSRFLSEHDRIRESILIEQVPEAFPWEHFGQGSGVAVKAEGLDSLALLCQHHDATLRGFRED